MPHKTSVPGAQQKRLAAYLDSLARAAGHANRIEPLKGYCKGLLLPLKRKSVEPMAALLAPHNVRRAHQSLHHLVADSPWSDQALLAQVRGWALPLLKKKEPLVAWIVDDTGIPKKGKYSVGVARQYCGQLGKQENCQVAVSLSAASWRSSLPLAWRLYLPESWARDRQRRLKAGVPEEVRFQTKPQIALDQIRRALEDEVEPGVVLADAAYGNDSAFRAELREMKLAYVVGIQGTTSVWKPGEGPLPPQKYKGQGRPPRLLRRGKQQPLAARELALGLPAKAWKKLSWRQGEKRKLVRALPRYGCGRRIATTSSTKLIPSMAADRMAPGESGTGQVLAVESARGDEAQTARRPRPAPLDHRAGLSGAQARAGTEPIRGAQLAGISTITGHFALRRMGSWWARGAVFLPRQGPASYEYPCPRGLRKSARAGHPIRAARHNPQSIATLRRQISQHLLHQLDACLFCGAPFL